MTQFESRATRSAIVQGRRGKSGFHRGSNAPDAFGSAALLMAAMGIYGVLAYSVQQHAQELGERMALGAQASNLRNMAIRQGMVLTMIGVLLGIGGALWLRHFLKSFLFGVKTLDPIAFFATPLLLICAALVSVWAPAVRATRVDPMSALRVE